MFENNLKDVNADQQLVMGDIVDEMEQEKGDQLLAKHLSTQATGS